MSEGFLLPHIALMALSAAYLVAYSMYSFKRMRTAAAIGGLLLTIPVLFLCATFVFILLRSFS